MTNLGGRETSKSGGGLGGLEHADGGDTGGACGEGCRGVFGGDAAEGEDRDRSGSGACELQQVEADAFGDQRVGVAGDASDFLEDGAEEDDGGGGFAGGGDLVEGVAGDADDWLRQSGGGVEAADLRGGEFAGGGGEVDAVGSGGDGDVGAGVDEELRRLWATERRAVRSLRARGRRALRLPCPFRGAGRSRCLGGPASSAACCRSVSSR